MANDAAVFSFTNKRIEALPTPKNGRARYRDASTRGLGLSVTDSGHKSFFWVRKVRDYPERRTLGVFPELDVTKARDAADGWNDKLAKWRARGSPEPNPFRHSTAEGVEAVIEEWLTRDVRSRTRTAYEVERRVNKDILPAIKGKLITEVGRPELRRMMDAIVDRGAPAEANEVLSVAKRWLNWCVERGYLEVSPANSLKPPSDKKSRDRVLTENELRDVWNAAGTLGYPNASFLRLLILSAQRRGEVAGMTWDEIDFDKKLWTLSAARTKANRIHDVPLSPEAIEILESLPRFTGEHAGPHVFSNTEGKTPINSHSKCKAALDAAVAKVRKDAGIEEPIPDYVVHDFRRTASTFMAEAGFPPHVVAAILNHSPGSQQGVTSIYNRFRYGPERRAALEAWGKYVKTLAETQVTAKPGRLKVARRA